MAIDISGLDAQQLDELVALARERRSKLHAPLPDVPAPELIGTEDPAWRLELRDDGRTHLWLRDLGVGWVLFTIPANERAHLAAMLLHHSLYRVASKQVESTGASPAPAGGGGRVH